MNKNSIEKITIIGTGMIGVSMAVLFTGHGYQTTVLSRSQKSSDRALRDYKQYFSDLVDARLINADQSKRCTDYLHITENDQDISDSDFIIESVYENLEVKREVFRRIESICRSEIVIASMTSGMSPDLLVTELIHKSRLLVAHPFMPPHLVPCVEVVKSAFTSEDAVSSAIDLFSSVGREVIVLKKGIEGFIANRLQHAMIREAIYLIEKEIATAEDIDRTLITSFGPRYSSIGIFEHIENTGLDLFAHIQEYLLPTLCNDSKPQKALMEQVHAGNFGSKTGKGFLDWSKKDLNDLRRRRSEPYFKYFNWKLPQ